MIVETTDAVFRSIWYRTEDGVGGHVEIVSGTRHGFCDRLSGNADGREECLLRDGIDIDGVGGRVDQIQLSARFVERDIRIGGAARLRTPRSRRLPRTGEQFGLVIGLRNTVSAWRTCSRQIYP